MTNALKPTPNAAPHAAPPFSAGKRRTAAILLGILGLLGLSSFLYTSFIVDDFSGIDGATLALSRNPQNDVLFFRKGTTVMAVLNQRNARPESSSYNIHFNPSISTSEAADFFRRSLSFCCQREGTAPFCLSFRVSQCPEWGADFLRYGKDWLRQRGKTLAYDNVHYTDEQAAYEDYLKPLVDESKLAPHRRYFLAPGDFYIDLRKDDAGVAREIIFGDVNLYFNQPCRTEQTAAASDSPRQRTGHP